VVVVVVVRYGSHVVMEAATTTTTTTTMYPWLKGNKLIEPYTDTTLRIMDVSDG